MQLPWVSREMYESEKSQREYWQQVGERQWEQYVTLTEKVLDMKRDGFVKTVDIPIGPVLSVAEQDELAAERENARQS